MVVILGVGKLLCVWRITIWFFKCALRVRHPICMIFYHNLPCSQLIRTQQHRYLTS